MRTLMMLAIAAFMALSPLLASAGVTNFQIRKMPVIIDGEPYVVHDFLIDFEGNLRTQEMIVRLSNGKIFQHELGFLFHPGQEAINNDLDLRYDSFVTIGGLGLDLAFSTPILVAGAAVDIQSGVRPLRFNEERIDIAWAPSPGEHIPSGTNYPIARITMSPDVHGTVLYFGTTSGNDSPYMAQIPLSEIPEPSTLAMTGIATSLALLLRRHN